MKDKYRLNRNQERLKKWLEAGKRANKPIKKRKNFLRRGE